MPSARYDAIIVGGGHNGLVCAAYLARAGRRVLVAESRSVVGGPCAAYEFMPGYRASFANSPGSFEPRVIEELALEAHGLSFLRTDPTVVHPFPSGCFVGWRDRARVAAQLDAFAAGEGARYAALMTALEDLGLALGVSLFEPSPDLVTLTRRVPAAQASLFEKVFFGSLTQLLDEALESDEAKALLGMVALNTNLAPPSAPGTAVGLMMRPFSIASTPPSSSSENDPRRMPLRGSTGLPRGGMGAVVEALAACCRHAGVELRTDARVKRFLMAGERICGVALAGGEELAADVVVSTVNPTLLPGLLAKGTMPAAIERALSALPMRGSAFKIALALDGLPSYAGLPADLDPAAAAAVQIRVAPSLAYIERAVGDALAGRTAAGPIMWGLIPSVTAPELAPKGRHILSINAWHAPYALADGEWTAERREAYGNRCVAALSEFMPDLAARIIDRRFIDPVELEAEFDLVQTNATHGDMLPGRLFGARPTKGMANYRTPVPGLYVSGSGTWPGGYVTGAPGRNASQAVLADAAIR